eukprot:scaffold2.g6952.t1
MLPRVSPFKPDVLASRVALITGGGSGIGLEIARQLGLHGARVVITGRREQVLQEACRALGAEGVEARYVQGDVRAPADCDNMVAQAAQWAGRLDVLVNCAAGNFLAPAEALSSGGFRTVMEIDATHASAAKAAVDSMTRSMALEWGAYGIRVNGVAPGPIQGTAGGRRRAGGRTGGGDARWRPASRQRARPRRLLARASRGARSTPRRRPGDARASPRGRPCSGMAKLAPTAAEQMEEMVAAHIPLGRMGANSAGGFVTGHTLVVDGAEWMYREPIVPREVVTKLSRGVEAHSRGVGLAGGDGWRSKM